MISGTILGHEKLLLLAVQICGSAALSLGFPPLFAGARATPSVLSGQTGAGHRARVREGVRRKRQFFIT